MWLLRPLSAPISSLGKRSVVSCVELHILTIGQGVAFLRGIRQLLPFENAKCLEIFNSFVPALPFSEHRRNFLSVSLK